MSSRRAPLRLVLLAALLLGCAATATMRPRAKATSGPIVSFDEQGTPTVTLLDAPEDASILASWGGAERTFALERSGPDGVARLEGAPRGADVRYEVRGERASGPWTLRTLPERDAARWSFAALGDSGRSFAAKGPGPDQLAVARLLDDLAPDLVLHAGDVVYDDDKAWAMEPYFSTPHRATLARVPLFVAIGNHDLFESTDAPELRRAAARPPRPTAGAWFSFDVGDVHFAVLDSNAIPDGDASGFRATKQGRWLETDLAASTARTRVCVLHHPLYSAKRARAGSSGLRETLAPLLARGRVALVIAGHDHHYHRTRPIDGVVHVTTGGGGAALYDGEPQRETAAFAKEHHLVRVVVERAALTIAAIAPASSARGASGARATGGSTAVPRVLDRFTLAR